MVKKFFMAITLLIFPSIYSMEPEHINFSIPHTEVDGQEHDNSDDITKKNVDLLLLRNFHDTNLRETDSPDLTSPSPSPTSHFRTISPETPDTGIVLRNDDSTKNLSQNALQKLESFSHAISFSPRPPRLATPEPIHANDQEIATLINAYKSAHAKLPADAIRDVRLQYEYQIMVEAKLRTIEHLKQSSGIGDFPDQSDAIIARQEKVIAYLKEKIKSLEIDEKLELRKTLEKVTDALIADIRQNLIVRKIKDETTLYRINVLLEHMEEERNAMSDKTLLTDPKFDIMMTVRQMKIQELRDDIEKLMSPNPTRPTIPIKRRSLP